MTPTTFGLSLPETTTEAAHTFDRALTAQIDELNNQLQLMQALRRANAAAFGIDRREGVGKFGEMADAAKRAEYEGDSGERQKADGRLKVAS
ncbi:hypothetical protein GA830_10295 [Mesorhizobium sp. NBSH29]|uniref:hypothetical protein n=1 Tax=Mesorhizobium sp. NBSH29 TaxID=2654249 RepID=UPI0018965FB6|nr:hypothetical protein [Mesorhizobium sp. NBSH29]QPC87085.1 hypothetical protein GA830_10295 [Mesorhizobium sp. NBSH29]